MVCGDAVSCRVPIAADPTASALWRIHRRRPARTAALGRTQTKGALHTRGEQVSESRVHTPREGIAMGTVIYVNGRFMAKEEATVSVYDHGFLYGDGVFEGIRAYHGRIFKLDAHVNRLFESAHTLGLQVPLSREEMTQAILETVRRTGLQDAYIRPVVSRGPGDLGIDPRKGPKPNVVIIVDSIQLHPAEAYRKGLRMITTSTRQRPVDVLNPRIKTCNYLNNIMARMEANLVGVD